MNNISKKQELINKKSNFLDIINKHFPYRQGVVAWDIVNNDYYSIKNDIKKGRVTKKEVKEIIDITPVEFIFNEFYLKRLIA